MCHGLSMAIPVYALSGMSLVGKQLHKDAKDAHWGNGSIR